MEKKVNKAIRDIEEEDILITLLNAIGDWFANHPQASKDCRSYIERTDVFEKELLDNVFGEETEAEEFYDDDDVAVDTELPKKLTISATEIDVDNWGDEDEVGDAIGNYLSDVFGFCPKGFSWELDTRDSGEVQTIIVSDIDWDLSE